MLGHGFKVEYDDRFRRHAKISNQLPIDFTHEFYIRNQIAA